MDIVAQKKAAKQFATDWDGRGDEKQDSQSYWTALLRNVYGVEQPEQYIQFEKVVAKGFIDAYIPATKVLIEQKGIGIDLDAKEPRQGRMVTPYEQARDYVSQLGFEEKPKYIVTCNFKEIRIYDTKIQPSYDRKTDTWHAPYEELLLKDLESEYWRLQFLVNVQSTSIKKELEISIKAGDLVGLLYDAFLKQYANPDDPETLKSLNVLCVRLVFCLYAEDAGIFGQRNMFHDYMEQYPTRQMRKALAELFRVLDQDPEKGERDPYLAEDNPELAAFPYVNGGLFADEHIEIPPFTDEIRELILRHASQDFDWSEISPTIFGAVFESTLNPETRRAGGMHYTSIENIHKVVDPLFLDDLKTELDEIKSNPVVRTKKTQLLKFQDKLASLTWLEIIPQNLIQFNAA